MSLFKCSVCGYIYEGNEPPTNCPKCGATSDKFDKMSDDDAKLIYRSDKTNDLHIRLIALASEMDEICKQGIEDNLDPGCVDVFTKTKNMAWKIKTLSKTEIVGHIGKKKW